MTPTTESRESVEKLAERIVEWFFEHPEQTGESLAGSVSVLITAWHCSNRIAEHEAKKQPYPTTMQPMDDGIWKYDYGDGHDQPPQAEPVVTERDRSFAKQLLERVQIFPGPTTNEVAMNLARHNAAEREERLELMDRASHAETKCEELQERINDLQAQLSEAKKRVGEFSAALRKANDWMFVVECHLGGSRELLAASTRQIVCNTIHNLKPQPATPSDEGK